MGEILKKMGKLPNGMEIELNAPQTDDGVFIIHIQDERGRIALTKEEFVQLALLFYDAKTKLEGYKKK